jgi:DNA invertase Pin-like site-specific DNA recombinase
MATLIAYLRGLGDGHSELDTQRDAVRVWARHKRHRVIEVIEEDDQAASLAERSGLVKAVAALRNGGAEGIVLYRLDGLDEDLVAQEQLLAELRRVGARVYSLDPEEAAQLRHTPTDPSRQMVRQVLESAAGNEGSMIALRSATRSANGSGPGSPPFGYRVDDGTLIPDADEQKALERIATLRASGATLREMARLLEAEGLRTKRTARWHPETLRRILQRLNG